MGMAYFQGRTVSFREYKVWKRLVWKFVWKNMAKTQVAQVFLGFHREILRGGCNSRES